MTTETIVIPHVRRKVAVKPYFENLDTLRALSALSVFFFHAGLIKYIQSLTSSKLPLYAGQLISSGAWGVSFFFVLSGFLITWLLLEEYKSIGRFNIRAFYLRRFFRIWPLYYLIFFAGAVLLPLLYNWGGYKLFFDYKLWYYGAFLSNYGYMSLNEANDSIRSFPLVMNISWSVSIEEQFYLVWPILFAVLPRVKFKYIPQFFIAFSVGMALLFTSNGRQLYLNTGVRLGELAIGGSFAVTLFNKGRFFSYFVNFPKLLTSIVYILSATLILIDANMQLPGLGVYFLRMVVCMLFAVIIVEQNFSYNSFVKFGRWKVLDRLGKVSYGIYMLHPLALFVMGSVLQLFSASTGPLYIVSALILTIFSARLSFKYLEMPFLIVKRRFEKLKGLNR
jgi:peptidoglycan/LPS O-acetylase OafA/YrhL